jgi:hypothetical protein
LTTPIARWRWYLLIFGLFLFALILVLPQVDLPDTALRDGSSPVLTKLQVSGVPVLTARVAQVRVLEPALLSSNVSQGTTPSSSAPAASRVALLCTLLC